MASPPTWLQIFLDRLAADDLSAATRRGYRYDLLHFIGWYTTLYDTAPELIRLTEHDLITWPQHMITQGAEKAYNLSRQAEAALAFQATVLEDRRQSAAIARRGFLLDATAEDIQTTS
jgi:hypothetical protein